jgi:outer membrane autotransporter protein
MWMATQALQVTTLRRSGIWPNGGEFSVFLSGGHDFHIGHLTIGPIVSLQYTYVRIDGFIENSTLVPLQIRHGSQESLRTDLGFRASYEWQVGKVLVEPYLKAAWEH